MKTDSLSAVIAVRNLHLRQKNRNSSQKKVFPNLNAALNAELQEKHKETNTAKNFISRNIK